MKTLDQILDKYQSLGDDIDDTLEFYSSDLLQFVPFRYAYPYLKEKMTPAEWEEYYKPLSKKNVKQVMKEYMSFAWGKCCGERGLSALRSIAHYRAWIWILDDKTAIEYLDNYRNYTCFGAPMLQFICKRYKWKWQDFVNPWSMNLAEKFLRGEGC